MIDLILARDATKRITEVADTIEEVIERKELWLADYVENKPGELTTGGALARRMLIDMLQLNIAELKRIREHLLRP